MKQNQCTSISPTSVLSTSQYTSTIKLFHMRTQPNIWAWLYMPNSDGSRMWEKKEELTLKYRKMYWLMGRYSALSVYNKLMLYQQVIKPVWTYGIQLWGCTSQSNRNIIQRFQNRVLRGIIDAPWYCTFEMTTYIRIWMWKLSITSSKSMLKVMNNDFNGTST